MLRVVMMPAILHVRLPGLDLINFVLRSLPGIDVLLGPVYMTSRVCDLVQCQKYR